MNYYYLNDGYLSNFRTINAINDVVGALLRVKDVLPPDEVRDILWPLLVASMQANYTGRCLGGIIDPNKTNKVDRRNHASEAIELMKRIRESNQPDEEMLLELLRQLTDVKQ